MSRWIACSIVWFVLALPSARANTKGPKLNSRAYVVIDNDTGQAIIAHNEDQPRAIASLSKLFAALVFRDKHLELTGQTAINSVDRLVASGGCRTRLKRGWTYRNDDLLHAMLMASDNQAVSALGRAVGLQPATSLVRAMNMLARQYGLLKTHFADPTGINYGNVSTALEVAQAILATSKDPILNTVMGKSIHLVRPAEGIQLIQYLNTNPLVGNISDVRFLASKTGFNSAANYCLAGVVELPGQRHFTIVLLGAPSKGSRVQDLDETLRWLKLSTVAQGKEPANAIVVATPQS